MAIFYEYIKGLNNSNLYSYIYWTEGAPTFSSGSNNYGPFLIAGNQSRAYSYNVYSSFNYYGNLVVNGNIDINSNLAVHNNITIDNNYKIQWNYNNVVYFLQFVNDEVKTAKLNITDELTAKSITATTDITANDLRAYNVCEAKYFNSTSDLRAKRGIKNAAFDALDIIKNVPVKCFQYQDEDEEAPYSIGIIAQDVLDYPADKFELVNNPEASGISGDYMTIKESKLVYILWKALQEQQEEIEELTETIKQMKKDLN